MKKIIYAIISLSLICTANIFAQSSENYRPVQNPESFQEQLEQTAAQTKTLEATFTQTQSLSFLETSMESKGNFFYDSEEKLRWEYTDPFEYAILFKGETLHILDAGDVNKIELGGNEMFQSISSIMKASIHGDIFGMEDFDVEVFEGSENYKASLKPLNEQYKQYLDHMEVFIDVETYQVQKVILFELSGDNTQIEFTSRKINELLPEGIFEVK